MASQRFHPLHWRTRPVWVLAVLVAISVVALFWSIGSGPVPLTWGEIAHALSGSGSEQASALIWKLRLPRAVLAFVAGGVLGLCGAALQGLFRNPLADPGLIGISAGGTLGAVTAIVTGFPVLLEGIPRGPLLALPLAAFTGALLATAAVYRIAAWHGRIQVATLLLAGVAVNAIAGSMIGWLTFIATDGQLRDLTFWSLGSVGGASWENLAACAPFLLGAMLILPRHARALNAMALGEANARHMGVAVERVKRAIVLSTALAIGAVVAFTGAIGFVGLIGPHLFRLAAGPDHRWVFPGAFFTGGSLLAVADVIARTVVAPAEIPVGIIVATVGAPFFLFLLLKEKRRGAA